MGSATPVSGHRPARQRGRWTLLALAGLSLPLVTACGATTPLCDDAAALLQNARLDDSAITYAQAEARGEGDCASAGLDSAGSAYQEAIVNVARGRSAENTKDVDGAVSAYETALQVDRANPSAADGLKRLGRPVPALRPTVVEPAAVPVAVSVPWWPFVVAGALLLAAMAAAWWWARTVLDRREREAGKQTRDAVAPLQDAVEKLRSRAEEIRSDLAAVSTRTEELGHGLGLAGAGAAAESREPDPEGDDAEQDSTDGDGTARDDAAGRAGGATVPETPAGRPPTLAAQMTQLREQADARARDDAEWRRRMEGHLDDVVDHLDGSPRDGATERRHFSNTES